MNLQRFLAAVPRGLRLLMTGPFYELPMAAWHALRRACPFAPLRALAQLPGALALGILVLQQLLQAWPTPGLRTRAEVLASYSPLHHWSHDLSLLALQGTMLPWAEGLLAFAVTWLGLALGCTVLLGPLYAALTRPSRSDSSLAHQP